MAKKIRILGIAPYQNLRTAMLQAAEKYDNIEMTVYTGNLEDGVQIALQHMDEGFDIIISRGGTAEMIREVSRVPVVEITVSINDILRSALMFENTGQRYAIVGYPNITRPAQNLCEMMNYDAPIVTIHQKDDLDEVLEKLKRDGYNLILCDVISEIRTREAGMEPILIVSGPEGIASAIDSAINICEETEETMARSRLFTEALKLHGKQTVILKEDGTVLFSAYNEEKAASVIEYLRGLIRDSQELAPKGFHMIDNTLYSILAKQVDFMERTSYIFSLEQNPIPTGGSRHGLRFSSYTEMSVLYSS
ncbi:MAG: PrpR N-terminal domain-containing protein, partial [Lachnospiraceae bacterium]|nr:PrpR N-terminal domain-containing protein [Lachnospiraceae bacterium]